MGGAQPLAITMAGGTCLIADVDQANLERRVKDRYLDEVMVGVGGVIDRTIDLALDYVKRRKARSVGVNCNAIELLERLIARGITPDVLTDQTSAHDPLIGYVPVEMTAAEAGYFRVRDPKHYQELSIRSMERHVRALVDLQKRGAVTFDYGNNIRQRALDSGFAEAFAYRNAGEVFEEIKRTENPKTGYDLRGMNYARLRKESLQWPCGPGEERGRERRYRLEPWSAAA
jgi:urocanate hydratase